MNRIKLTTDHLLFAVISGAIVAVIVANGDAFSRLGAFFAG